MILGLSIIINVISLDLEKLVGKEWSNGFKNEISFGIGRG